MFKKIEIWILYITLVFVFIFFIIFGAMIRRETLGGGYIPIITPVSKVAMFLAEIPFNLKSIVIDNPHRKENRFQNKYGFVGEPNKDNVYLLLSRYNNDVKNGIVELVDLQNFEVMHSWNPDFNLIEDHFHLDDSPRLDNSVRQVDASRLLLHPVFDKEGSLIFHNAFYFKIDSKSNFLDIKHDVTYHHSTERDFDNNFWICVSYFPYKIDSKYVGNKYLDYNDDGIRKISENGEILFDKSVSEILIENDMEYLLFSVTDNYKVDPIHLNDIQPVNHDSKFWKRGDVFLSLRNLSLIILYRPTTNEIIWKSKPNKIFNQHDVNILDDHRVSIFNNNMKFYNKSEIGVVDGHNQVVIYNFQNDEYSFYLNESLEREDVRTIREGQSEILPNGDLFVQENNYGRLLYFNKDGSLRWENINRASDGSIYTTSWSRILHSNEDIKNIKRFLKTKNK